MSDNIDMKKTLKHLYQPFVNEVSIVGIPEMNYLMIDGYGNPNISPSYSQSVSALYQLSYGIRALIKKRDDKKFTVMPLEGLWWAEDMTTFSADRKEDWQWTMMILQPDFVSVADFQEVQADLLKKKDSSHMIGQVRFESYHEGRAAQLMHIGPYAAEAPNIQWIHQHIEDSGYQLSGKHHEIYLSDPNKVAPEKLKTILRQPFR